MPTTRKQLIERESIDNKNINILIGVTGSVTATNLLEIIRKLNSAFQHRIRISSSTKVACNAAITFKIVVTESAKQLIDQSALRKSFSNLKIEIYDDSCEWISRSKVANEVLHIELRNWADLCLIVPLSANTMAKLVHGICDNLLTCVARAWDHSKPFIYCPVMNLQMWNNPLTAKQIRKLQSRGYLRVEPAEKNFACGEVAPVESIVEKVLQVLPQHHVSKSTCLPEKLVSNQSPTYQITSVSNSDTDQDKPTSKLSQIVEKLKTNSKPPSHLTSTISEPPACKIPRTNSACSADLLQVDSRNQNRFVQPQASVEKSNAVTSLQNLKAIDLRRKTNAHLNNHSTAPINVESNCDLDPSRRSNRTRTTDNCLNREQDTRSTTNTNIANLELRTSYTETKLPPSTEFVSPLLDATKVLTLCHNPAKDCFTCVICKNDYKNRKSMARHLKELHIRGNIFRCLPCGVSYRRRENLIKHNRERHANGQPHQVRIR